MRFIMQRSKNNSEQLHNVKNGFMNHENQDTNYDIKMMKYWTT